MLSLKTLVPFGLLTSAQILIAGFVVYYIGWIIYSRCFHPYHDIPGPFLASITQWWYFRTIRYGIAENSQLPLHKKYGKFVRNSAQRSLHLRRHRRRHSIRRRSDLGEDRVLRLIQR